MTPEANFDKIIAEATNVVVKNLKLIIDSGGSAFAAMVEAYHGAYIENDGDLKIGIILGAALVLDMTYVAKGKERFIA